MPVKTHEECSISISAVLSQPGGEKERCSSSPVGFHMVAELPAAAVQGCLEFYDVGGKGLGNIGGFRKTCFTSERI